MNELDWERLDRLKRGLAVTVNIRHEECDVYIGRKMRGHMKPEDGIFGNPFKGDGWDVKYRKHLADKLLAEPEFRKKVEGLRAKRLGCWCWPEPCHGEFLAEFANATEDERKDFLDEYSRTPINYLVLDKEERCQKLAAAFWDAGFDAGVEFCREGLQDPESLTAEDVKRIEDIAKTV